MSQPRPETGQPANRPRKIHPFGPGLAAAALLLAASGVVAGDLEDVKAKGKLVVATFPLIEDSFMAVDVEAMRQSGLALKDMRNPDHFRGIDLDLVKGFAESLGVKLEIRPELAGYGDLIPALDRGEGDVAASSFAITPQRLAAADFSTPYIQQWDVAAVRPDRTIRSIADLKGKRVAVIGGSSHFERLKALNLDPEIRLTKFVLEGYDAVTEGQADYTLLEVGLGGRFDATNVIEDPLAVVITSISMDHEKFLGATIEAMRKGSNLKPLLDAYLEGLRKSGELDRILARHGQGSDPKKP
jgi:ABC-type amino acid transport substrate-binding protein